jgi:hypothetical protein
MILTAHKLSFFFLFSLSQGAIQSKSLMPQKALNKSIYIEQFKLTYFRKFLLKSYNNSKAIQETISLDHSGFTEPILTQEDYKLIDSLTTLDNKAMQMDSVNRIGRVAEGVEGKQPLAFILTKLESKWLDRLANERFKIYRRKKE